MNTVGEDAHYHQAMFEVVEDMLPVEAGGFKKGARISRLEMEKLLADRMLAKGTTVIHLPTGMLYHVDYGGL